MLRRARSVRRKVMLVILATTVTALLVTALAMLVYETRAYRTAVIDDLTTQADILARASGPALLFDDPAAASENLALLRARPQILAATILTADGRPYAQYRSADLPKDRAVQLDAGDAGYRIQGDEIVVSHPVVERNQSIGRVLILARYELVPRLRDYLGILAAVLIASLAVAALLSAALQRAITQPIIAVTQAAKQVMERRDFSLRVPKTTHDEIGILVEAFNAMLAEVGRRADALEQSNWSLTREAQERREAEEALRAGDRRKDEFLATLAHELRNPLAPLRNALEIQKLAPDDPRVMQQARDMMDRQLTQMVRLVDDLLDVSRINTGKLSLRKDLVELAAVVRSAVDTVRPFVETRRHVLQVELPDAPVYVAADTTRLAQVFSNLLHNAAKFTPPGGRISLEARRTGDEVEVSVIDNGIGMKPELLGSVFDMFVQGDQSLERAQAGLGVGLTLARRLVELHGGSIEAHSDGPGHGSRFTVRLPAAHVRAQDRGDAQPAQAAAPASGHRVLIVDDNQDFANSLAVILRAMDNEVRVAHDGMAGLEIAQAWQPDIGFLDIGMPRLNGYDLARRLRASAGTSAIALIAVTGWGQDKDRRDAMAAGFDHHLVKPVEANRILEILGTVARRSG